MFHYTTLNLKFLSHINLRCLTLLSSILLASGAFSVSNAQILNIERARVERDTSDYWTGRGSINFSMYNRNAGRNNPNNYLSLTGTADVAYISKRHGYMLFNSINYVLINYDNREQRNTVANNGFSHIRVNLFRRRKLSYELFTQYQYDDARGLNVRTLNGGGLRYTLLRSDDVSLYLGSGLMWEHEEWKDPEQEGVLRLSDLAKSTNYVSTRARISSGVDLNSIVYFQTGYDRSISTFRHRVSGDITIGAKLNKYLTLRTGFNCTYESIPIVPVTKFIYSMTNGVQMAF